MKKLLLAAITLLIFSKLSIAQDKWQNVVTNTFGGDPGNKAVTKMHVFKGQIYGGTGTYTAEVYRSSTGHNGSWLQAFAPANQSSIDDINSTTEGGGYIYVSSYGNGSDGPRISRSADGDTWVPYYEGYDKLPFVFPFKGTGAVDSIYIVREVYPFSMILKSAYDSNDPTNSSNSFDTVFTTPAFDNIKSYAIHNNKIYVGTNNTGKIWISSTNGNSWEQDTLFQPGFGNSNNSDFTAMVSFGGYLYVGTENYSDGAQIWRSNNDTTWTNVASFPGSTRVTSLNNLSGKLWVTLESSTKGKILKSVDGITYVFSDSVGFGADGNDGMKGSTVLFDNHIYYAYENYYSSMPQMTPDPSRTGSGSGGQVWRYCLGALPVVDLGLDQTVCVGVAVTFDAGVGHTAYEWSNETTLQTINVTDPGHYSVIVTGANGCQNTDSVRLINSPSPVLYVSMPEGKGPHLLCKNDTLDIFIDASSNIRNPLTPINKPTSVQISNPLGTTYDTITVSGINDWAADALYSVTIDSLYHVYDGDVTLSLQAPDLSMITLVANLGGGGQNYMGTVFKKTGADITAANAPFTGVYMPFNPFSNLSGSADGQWILHMNDSYSTDDGILKGWSIRFAEKDTIMTYSWTPATGLIPSASVRDVSVVGDNSTLYELTVTNSIGCSTKDSVDVYVPKMQVASSSVTACYGDSVMISATGGVNYNWYPSSGLSNTNMDSVFALPTVPTTYYVSDTIDGVCYIIDSVLVNANSQIIVDAGVAQSLCLGDTAIFNGSATGGSGPYTYYWNGGGSNYSTQTINVSPLTLTNYALTVTDIAGCTATDTTTLTINTLPMANAGTSQSICLLDTAVLNGFATAGTPGYTFLWNDGSTTYSLQNITVTPLATTTYTLTVSDANGCTAMNSAVVTVNALPTADAGAAQSICLSANGTLNGSATGGAPAYIYLWDNGATTSTIIVSPAADTVFVLTVTDALGCTDKDSTAVTVNPLPIADAGISQTFCFSASDTLNGMATGGTAPYTYLWNSSTTTYAVQNPIVSPSATTTYTLTVTDDNGCTAMDNVSLSVTPSTNIYGHVAYSGGNLANGKVVLYKYYPYQTHFDTTQVFTLTPSGDYQFLGVDYGDYLIEVFADTAVVSNSVPTYYGNASLWDSSTVVVHGCTENDTADITLIEIPVLVGPGRLSGNISKGPGFGNSPLIKAPPYAGERADPIPGIDVKLGKKPGGGSNIVGQTQTNNDGDYNFDNLPLNVAGEAYVVFVDIPGLGRDSSYVVSLTIADSVIFDLDYIADSTLIYIPTSTVGINDPKVSPQHQFSIYPNPANSNATVEYTLINDANVSLNIYNVLGVKVLEAINNDQQEGTYKYNINARKNNLTPGVYFITLLVDGKANTERLIIIE